MFRETKRERAERVVLGTIWSLMPKRFGVLLPLALVWVADLVRPDRHLPDVTARAGAHDLVGIAHDLSVPTLLAAYRRSLFPHGHFGPVKWLSPPERCVLFFDAYHMSKRLKRLMRQDRYTVSFDRDYEGVIKACAGKREGRWHVTWITPRIMHAYAALFDAGIAHSFEVWDEDGALVGGGYGVAVGRVFFTESQFSHQDNTSKLGFSVLNYHLAKWGYVVNDGKWRTPTILDMGFRSIPRAEFIALLDRYARGGGGSGRWSVEAGPKVVADWDPKHLDETQVRAAG